ncbi:hypothetical protein LSCM1_07364 [Leishmania martiniquensis]|uniref:Uncharacterized protein n=1 Tax=Leishmania martiniquensis TaxID=1580590 RepID=A0A836HHD1_9TRYP|nr:hypothetical protein LSCM1_07364 [Leishmania martiniquensis]
MHTNASVGSPLTLTSSTQSPFTHLTERPRLARPPAPLSEKQDPHVEDTAAADEPAQRVELLALIARLRKLLMPATERLLRLHGILKSLEEQLVVVTPAAPLAAAASGTSAGASISSVSVSEANPPLRLCVTGASEPETEEVFHFVVHRDPPQMRCGTRSGVTGSASSGRSPAFSSSAGRGGRPSTSDTGLLVSPHASPSSIAQRRWSRLESGGRTAGTNLMASGDDRQGMTTPPPSSQFPSTPTSARGVMGAAHAGVHGCPSPGDTSRPHSPAITDSPLPDQFPLPTVHLHIASGLHLGGMRRAWDNEPILSHPPLTTPPPPLPVTVPVTTTATTKMGSESFGAAEHGSDVGRLPATGIAHNLQHCTVSPHPPPLSVTPGGSQGATPQPPLPAAPANHHVRRVRSTASSESRPVGSSAAAGVAHDTEAPSCESPTLLPEGGARKKGDGGGRTPSMSLSSTMPDLLATPPPPLPGFSKITTAEAGGSLSCIPSPQPATLPVVSLPSPTQQNIGVRGIVSHAAGASSGAEGTGSRCKAGNGHAFARASPSPNNDFPTSLTPIMINPLQRTSSQCSEASEQLQHYHRSLHGSSLSPGTARFITLPTPFFSRARNRQHGTGGHSRREDSTILSHISSFTPPAMRLVQRMRRRMVLLGQMQLRLSAWDLFHPAHIGSLHQSPLPTTTAAPCTASPAVLLNAAEQGSRQAKNRPLSRVNSSVSRLSNSRCQEYPTPLHGINTMPDTPLQVPLGPHWLVSINEEGVLRYEPLPSAAQPPPYMQCPPVATTADFAFLCVPYEALVRGMGSEAGHGDDTGTSPVLSASTGGVGMAVSCDGEAEEDVAAALDVLFGLFSGTRHQHSQAQRHNTSTGASSILVTVSGGGTSFSTPPALSVSSPLRDGEVRLPMSCTGSDGGKRTQKDGRQRTATITSRHEANASVVATARGGSRQEETASHEVNSLDASALRTRIHATAKPTTVGLVPSTLTPPHSAGGLEKEVALLPHRLDTAPGPLLSLTEEWLLPLRQALVDRTIFLLVKSRNEEVPTPSRRRSNPSSNAEYSDGAMDERVVQRFLNLAKRRYGVVVQPWRVIIFSHRDAKRARDLMLAVYAQRLRQQRQLSIGPQADTEVSQTPRTSGTSEDDGVGKSTSACDADVLVSSTVSPPPRSGARHCSLSPLESLYAAPGVPAMATPRWAQTPPGASLTSTSRLTLISVNAGSEWRRGRGDGASRRHDMEDDKRELADPVYTLLAQELSVPSLSAALEQYKPLLGYRATPRLPPQASAASTPAGSRFRVSFASGAGSATNTTEEGDQGPADGSRELPGAAGSATAIEGTTSTDVSNDSVDAEAAAACMHAREVVWRSSGAAGVSSALRYFQHSAVAHRLARAAFSVMAWTWQLSALLPAVIKDAQSRYTRLRHSRRHTQHKLQGVLRSLELHMAASPTKSVAALEARLQEGFRDLMQRFLRDLRRLLVCTVLATTTAAFSPATGTSSASWPPIGLPAYGQRSQQMPPTAPLDALLAYDSPCLREAHQRLARAVFHFHAFYLAGHFAFTAPTPLLPSRSHHNVPQECTPSKHPRPLSVYEQRHAALQEAISLAQLPLNTLPRVLNEPTATPRGEPCTRPGTAASASLLPPARANASATTTPARPVLLPTPPDSTTPTSMTAKTEAEEAQMPKVDFGSECHRCCGSRIMSAAGFTGWFKEKSTPMRPVRCSESVATPGSVADGSGSDDRAQRHLPSLSSSLLHTPAGGQGNAAACLKSASAVPVTACSGMACGRGVRGQEHAKGRMHSEQAADGGADVGGTHQLNCEELQQCRLAMERQLIAHVSQINTEIINFLLAACVAAVPRLQRDCVDAELARVKDAQAEIVSTFTTAVRGRKDAAISMSNLYAWLEDWSAAMSSLVSLVRSRPYLEKFITQLRAALCEDEVRALAIFRSGGGASKPSEEAPLQTPPIAGTSLLLPSAAAAARREVSAAATRLPVLSGTAMASGCRDSKDSTPKSLAEPHAAAPPSPTGAPCTFASTSLAAEVGHRCARMLRYYAGLAHQQHACSLSGDTGETCTGANLQRSAVRGDTLAPLSPSRSLRSLQGGTSTLISPCRSLRMKGGGGGRQGLGLSTSLSSMSAAWSREEEPLPVEGGARGPRLLDSNDFATAASSFFAVPTRSPVTDTLAVLLATTQEESPPSAQLTLALQAAAAADSGASGGGISARCDRKQALSPVDSTALDPLLGPVKANAAAAATHRFVKDSSGAWQRQLAQWRSAMTEAERPADDASAAPLLWILLDTWDETLLRMPYGLLLDLDTVTYGESLNRMSAELLHTQQSWKRRCEDSLARIERQLTALEGDLYRMRGSDGEARVEYTQELRAIFDAASALVASRDDALHEGLFSL